MRTMTQRRIEELVRAVIKDNDYSMSLNAVDPTEGGRWRVAIDTADGRRFSFVLSWTSSPDMYFAVKERLHSV